MATKQAATRLKLDPSVVVDAALRLADIEGLEAVTIRRLAQELDVTPMALYWHFRDKEALLAGVADRLWRDTADHLDAARRDLAGSGLDLDAWARMRLTLEALVATMRSHPAVAVLVPSRVVACEAGLDVTEQTLELLAEQGFDASRAAEIARFALCSAVMLVESQPGTEHAELKERADAQRRKRVALASLPADRYPHVVAAAEYFTDCSAPDSFYARGIDQVVDGIKAQAPPPPKRRGGRPSPQRSQVTGGP